MASPFEQYRRQMDVAPVTPSTPGSAQSGSPFEQYRVSIPETVAAPAPQAEVSDVAEAFGKGVAKGVVQTPGILGDVQQLWKAASDYLGSTPVLAAVPNVLNPFTTPYPTGEDVLSVVKQIPGMENILSPEGVEERFPDSAAVRYGSTVGEFVGGSAVPLTKGKYIPEVLMGAAAGLGAQTAEEAGGSQLAGALAVPLALTGGKMGIQKTRDAVTGQLGAARRATEEKVAKELLDVAQDPTQARINLKQGMEEYSTIPGFTPDPAQLSGDPGLQALRNRVATTTPAPFVQQRSENIDALRQSLEGVAPSTEAGSIGTVRQTVERKVGELSDSIDADMTNLGSAVDEVFLNTSAREKFNELLSGYRNKVSELKGAIQGGEFATEGIGQTAARQVEEAGARSFAETADAMPSKSSEWAKMFTPEDTRKVEMSESGLPIVTGGRKEAPELGIEDLEQMRQLLNDEARTVEQGMVTPANTQRLQRIDELRAAIDSAIDQTADTSASVREFRDFYRQEYAPRFRQGPGRAMTEKGRDLRLKVAEEDTLKKFIHSGASSKADAAQFKNIYGDEADGYVRSMIRNELGDAPTGQKVSQILTKYRGVLSEFPEVRKDLKAVSKGTSDLESFVKSEPDVLGRQQPSGVERLTRGDLPEATEQADVEFWKGSAGKRTQLAKELSSKLDTPEEKEALRRSFYNWLTETTKGAEKTPAGGDTIKGSKLLREVNANTDTMKSLGYSDQQIQRIRLLSRAADLESQVRGRAAQLTTGSPTATDQANRLAESMAKIKDRVANTLYTVGKGFVGSGYALTFGARAVGNEFYNRIQTETRNALLERAFTDPKFMDDLMTLGRSPEAEERVARELEAQVRYLIPSLQQGEEGEPTPEQP